jgi:hypothetical protein
LVKLNTLSVPDLEESILQTKVTWIPNDLVHEKVAESMFHMLNLGDRVPNLREFAHPSEKGLGNKSAVKSLLNI